VAASEVHADRARAGGQGETWASGAPPNRDAAPTSGWRLASMMPTMARRRRPGRDITARARRRARGEVAGIRDDRRDALLQAHARAPAAGAAGDRRAPPSPRALRRRRHGELPADLWRSRRRSATSPPMSAVAARSARRRAWAASVLYSSRAALRLAVSSALASARPEYEVRHDVALLSRLLHPYTFQRRAIVRPDGAPSVAHELVRPYALGWPASCEVANTNGRG
jgi:hypothetical protein